MSTTGQLVYTYVDSPAGLAACLKELEGCTRLAVDTEFIGEKYYYARLEVVQLSDGERIFLVDAPAVGDMAPLAKLLGNPEVLKLFHAGGQDWTILERETGARALPAFDTQVAAALLGFGAQVSLANLIESVLGVRVSSKHSTSDWSHRPLSEDQCLYAARDVAHLHGLHDRLAGMLEERNRMSWFEDEFAERLESVFNPEEIPPEEFHRRVKDWMSLSGVELAILRELALWREEQARRQNLPRKQVLGDEALVELARFQPMTGEKARKLRRVKPAQLFRCFDEVVKCIEKGRAVPRDEWPRKPRSERPDYPEGLVDVCQAIVRAVADREEVAPTVLATRADIQAILANRKRLDTLEVPLLHGWRRELVGEQIVAFLSGRLSLRLDEEGGLVFEMG